MKKTRKIPIKKREKSKQRATTFTKRRFGLFSKAAELCVLFDAQAAILVKSLNNRHGDFYSFGYPSTDNLLKAFLSNEIPRPLDKQTKESALALHDQCKTLKIEESEEGEGEEEEDSDKFWVQLESMDLDSIQSVEALNGIAKKIKSLRENVNNRLKCLKEKSDNDTMSS